MMMVMVMVIRISMIDGDGDEDGGCYGVYHVDINNSYSAVK